MEQMQKGIWHKNQTFTVASAPSVTGLVFMQVFRRYLAQKPDIYRFFCSFRDRLGFYAEIQIILGTV